MVPIAGNELMSLWLVLAHERLTGQQHAMSRVSHVVGYSQDVTVGRWQLPKLACQEEAARRRQAGDDRRATRDWLHVQSPTVMPRICRLNPDLMTMTTCATTNITSATKAKKWIVRAD